jgi:hypothetical protein
MEDVSIFYVHLVTFPVILHILWPFGIPIFPRFGTFLPVLVCCANKNLATLPWTFVGSHLSARTLHPTQITD